jgi:Tfp pilus assembly protein PilV
MKNTYFQKGQSVVEVIIAISLFVIIAGSSIGAVLGSFTTTRLAEEQTQATVLAVEGIEAVQSIRNQAWANMVVGTYGVSSISGTWAFNGTSDIDATEKFTRSIILSHVMRDTATRTILSSGGLEDPETIHVQVTVSWAASPTRNNSVVLYTYLTNWQLSRNIGGINSGPQPQIGAEDCTIFCKNNGYSLGSCRTGVPQCAAHGETSVPSGNKYCQNTSLGGTCCCLP